MHGAWVGRKPIAKINPMSRAMKCRLVAFQLSENSMSVIKKHPYSHEVNTIC